MPATLRTERPRLHPLAARLTALVVCAAQIAPVHAACSTYALPGVNVSGGEFNPSSTRYGYDYIYPQQAEFDLMRNLQLKLMRVPFAWERVQPTASGALSADEMTRLDAVIALATSNGITVVLDPHNYGTYHDLSLGSAASPVGALPDLWSRLAKRYANNPNVVFGMMNEPHDISADVWAAIAQRTLAAIRAAGATNKVLIPGTNWDGAQSWFANAGPVSNATALLPLARADANVVFEVHQYFDTGFSGTADTCTASADAIASLGAISSWARTNNVKLFLGEFGVSQRAECLTAMNTALGVIETNKDVWFGWTYWTAGAWMGTYPFNVESASGQAAQGAVLKGRAQALNAMSCPASGPAPAPAPAATPAPAPAPATTVHPSGSGATPAPVASPPPAATPAPAPVASPTPRMPRWTFVLFRWLLTR